MMRKLLVIALLFITEVSAVFAQSLDGLVCNWLYKREISIDHTQNPENVTDYSVLITLNTMDLIAQGKMNADGSDIRFTTNFSDNLSYWIEPGIQNEFGMNDDATHIWVKIPFLTANSTKTIYLLYGNPNASPKSDITTAFLFGDDFDDNSLDVSKWQTNYIASGLVNEQNGRIEHNSPAMMPEATGNIMSQQSFTGAVVLDMQFKKGGYVYRGAGLQEDFNSLDNRALYFWQDFGPFGPNVYVNSTSEVVDFRSDYWSREHNPEYYLRIYRKPDSTFRFTTEIPAFEDDGYKYWDHTITNKKMPLTTPLKVSAHDFVWQYAAPLWDRYEDNIRVRKYSEPEPGISVSSEMNVSPFYSFIENHSMCDGESYVWQGNSYTQQGNYVLNYTSINGCDSTYTLNLTVNPIYQFNESQVINEGGSISWHGLTYTTAGTYVASYSSVNGCDSVYTLNLSVLLAENHLCNWSYKRAINIDHTQNPENLTEYSVLLSLNTMDLIAQGKMNADGSDIRFTTDFTDNLEYWIEPGIQNEFGMNDDATHIWVKIPFLAANSTQTIYLLYGNPSATAKSNISTTFLFGDDFDDNSLDITKWDANIIASGVLVEQNNRLEHQSPSTFPESQSSIFSKQSFTGPIVVDMQFKKGGYVYRGAGLKQEHNVETNKAYFHWQDWGAFGPTIEVNGTNEVHDFRSDYWSRGVNPEYYLKIYRKPDGTFKFVGEIPSFEEDGYQYWEHTFTNSPMPLSQPLKVGSHDFVWQNAWWLWDRYEDNIRVRKYSEPEPAVNLMPEQANSLTENLKICLGDSVLWNGHYYDQAGTYTISTTNPVICGTTQTLNLAYYPSYSFTETHAICQGEVFTWQGTDYNSAGTYTINLASVTGCDSILNLNLIVNPTYTFTETHAICEGELYTWHGVSYSQAGNYVANYTSVNGCDSTYSLNLNLNPSFSFVENQTICEGSSFTWQGATYDQIGTYVVTYTSVNGCDSSYTLSLNVISPFNVIESHTICEGTSYNWQGSNYTLAGTYVLNFTNMYGCDSTYTLNLSVNPNYQFTENITICEGDTYNWQGSNYSLAGTYNATFTSINGCDSTYTLYLNVNPIYHFTENQSICEGGTYNWQGTSYSLAGTYVSNYSSVNGCDSTYTLNLSVIPIYTSIENHSICAGESFTWHGTAYSSPGTYVLNFTNSNGCDSTFTLNLSLMTINTTITLFPSSLYAMQNGALYQWLDCDLNYNHIIGANAQNYVPTQTGNYAVQITVGTCIDTSDCFLFNVNSLAEIVASKLVSIFPNPSSDVLYVEVSGLEELHQFYVWNVLGEVVYESQFQSKTMIQTSSYAPGLYTIAIKINDKMEYLKFIKE